MNSIEILERLIAFPTVSRDSNLDLIGYVAGLLQGQGVATQLLHSEDGHKANLFATIGPADKPGVMLSGAARTYANRFAVKAGSRAKLRDFSGGMTTHGDFARENGVGMVPAIHLYDSWGAPLTEPLVGLTSPDYYGGFLDQRIDEALAKVRGAKKK